MWRLLPTSLILVATVWLGWLTVSNLTISYYGFFEDIFLHATHKEWSHEEVTNAFMSQATRHTDGVARQIYPILLLVIAVIWQFSYFYREKNTKSGIHSDKTLTTK
jgi:ABC-type dipeptide/oligopeptide/nickel transport system permease component